MPARLLMMHSHKPRPTRVHALAALCAVLLPTACVSPRAVAPVGDSEPVELRLQAGDSIRIVTKERERLSLMITEIRPAALAGVTLEPAKLESVPEGRTVVVPYADLALIEVDRFSTVRTLVVPAVVLTTIAGIVLFSTAPPMALP